MRKGFTLVEIMLASAIGAVVAIVAVSALRMIVHGRDKAFTYSEINDKVRYASDMIRGDLRNFYRDTEKGSLLECQFVEGDESGMPHLRFYSVSEIKARPLQPESDVYEVHYFVKTDDESQRTILMRRYCPTVAGVEVNEESRPGGILMPLLEDVSDFRVSMFDGQEWQEEWVVEDGSLPRLIQVNFECLDERVKAPVCREVMVGLFRNSNVSQGRDEEEGEGEMDSEENPLEKNTTDTSGAETN